MKRSGIALLMLIFPFLYACVSISGLIPTPTPMPSATLTSTPLPTSTPKPTATLTSTALPTRTPDAAATQQYEDLFAVVQRQYDTKVIPSLKGKYTPLDDQTVDSAKKGYFGWKEFQHQTSNFILRADVTIETANRSMAESGCGFVFHSIIGSNDFVFLKQDGVAIYGITSKFTGSVIRRKTYHALTNPDHFKLTLVVYQKRLRFIIDDKFMLSFDDLVYVPGFSAEWGPAVSSGSDQDFGTRCTFSKLALWEIIDR